MNMLRKPFITLCAVVSFVSVSATQALPYGTATLDRTSNEWNLTNDFYAKMREAGKADKTIFSKLGLRGGVRDYDPCWDWDLWENEPGVWQSCDTDGDSIVNEEDNCWLDSNYDQTNSDSDETGDVCDWDLDGDGWANEEDNCPYDSNEEQEDHDFDRIGDACDNNNDDDIIVDSSDNCSLMSNPGQVDSDHDGKGDACDTNTDTDGDGIPDGEDSCPKVANMGVDADGDGIDDACDPLPVDLISFDAKATSKGTQVKWETANEKNLLGFGLYKAILIHGEECTQNIEDYASESIEHLTDKVIYGGQDTYEFMDEFTAEADKIYCYALFNIENDGNYKWLGVIARQ